MIQDGQGQLGRQLYGFCFLRAKLELKALEAAKAPHRPFDQEASQRDRLLGRRPDRLWLLVHC